MSSSSSKVKIIPSPPPGTSNNKKPFTSSSSLRNNNNNTDTGKRAKSEDKNQESEEGNALFMNVTRWEQAATYERAETLSYLMNTLVFSRLFSKDVFDVSVIDETVVVSGATHLTAGGITEELQRQALAGNVSVKATLVDPEKVKLAGSRQIGVCLDGFVSHRRRLLFEKVLQTVEEKYLKDVICKVRYSLREGDELPSDAMLFPLFKDLIDVKVKRFWNRAAWGVRSGLVHQIGEVRKGVRQKAASNAARNANSPTAATRKQNILLASGALGASLNASNFVGQDQSTSTLATNAAALAAVANEEVSSSTTPSSRRQRPFCSTNEYYVAVTQDGLPINRVWLGAFPTLYVYWASWDEDSVQFLRNWYSAWSQGENFFNFHHHQHQNTTTTAATTSSSSTTTEEQNQHQVQILLQQDPWFMWAARFLDPADFDFHAVRNPAPPLGSDDVTITKHIRTVLRRASLLINELYQQQQQQIFQQQKEMLESDVVGGRGYRSSRRVSTIDGPLHQQQHANMNTNTNSPSPSSFIGLRSLCQVVFVNCDLDKTRAMDTVSDLEREFFTSNNNKEKGSDHSGSGQGSSSSSSPLQRRKSYRQGGGGRATSRRRQHQQQQVSTSNANVDRGDNTSPHQHSETTHHHHHHQLKRNFNNSFVRTSHYWIGPESVQSPLCETLDIRSFPTLVSSTNKGLVHFVYEFTGYNTKNNMDDILMRQRFQQQQNVIFHDVHEKTDKGLRNSTLPLTKPNTIGGNETILGTQLDRHVFLISRDLMIRKQRRRLLRQQQLMRERGGPTATTANTKEGNNTILSSTAGGDFAALSPQQADVFGATMMMTTMTMMNKTATLQHQHQQGDGLDFASSVHDFTFGAGGGGEGGFASTMLTGPNALLLSDDAEEIIRKRGEAAAAVRKAVASLGKNSMNETTTTTTTNTNLLLRLRPLPWHHLDEDIKESIIRQLRHQLDIIDTPVTFEAKRIWCFDEISSSSSSAKNLISQQQHQQSNLAGSVTFGGNNNLAASLVFDCNNNNINTDNDNDNNVFRFLDRCMIRTKREIKNGYVDWDQRIKALHKKVSSDTDDPNDEMRIQVRIPDEFQSVTKQVSYFILRGLITEITYETKLKPILDLLLKACCRQKNTTRRSEGRVTEEGKEEDDDDDDEKENPFVMGATFIENSNENDFTVDGSSNLGLSRHHFDINLDVVMCCQPWTVWHANLNNPLRNSTSSTAKRTNNNNNNFLSSQQHRRGGGILSAASKNEITCQSCKRNVKFAEAAHFECLHCVNHAAAATTPSIHQQHARSSSPTSKTGHTNDSQQHTGEKDQKTSLTSTAITTPPTVLCFTCGLTKHDPSHVQAFFPRGSEYDEPIRTVWGRDNVNPLPQKRSLLGHHFNKTSSSTPFSDLYYTSIGTKYNTHDSKNKKEQEDTDYDSSSSSSSSETAAVQNKKKNRFSNHDDDEDDKNIDRRFSTTGIHADVYCDSCRVNIKGVRWKCAVCYDIDLCDVCFNEHVVDAPKWGTVEGAKKMISSFNNDHSGNSLNNENNNNNLVSSEEPPNMSLGGDSRDGRRRLCHYSHVFLRIATPAAGGSDEVFILPEIRKVTRDGLRKL